MRFHIYIFLLLLFSSCHEDKNHHVVLETTINHFEKNESTYPVNTRINILRTSSKKLEYEMRVKGRTGFAVFRTSPDIIIFKNFTSDSIQMDFVEQFSQFNEKKDKVILLLENEPNLVRLNVKFEDRVFHLYRSQEKNQKHITRKDSISEYDSNWFYLIKDLVPE